MRNKFQRLTSNVQTNPKFQILMVLVLILFIGCSTSYDARGIFHRIQRGENLLWIAKSYGVNLQDLAELNNISDEHQSLRPGEKLYIPPRREYRHKKLPFEGQLAMHTPPERAKRVKKVKERAEIYTEHSRFEWPVEGTIISPFGVRKGRRHDGVDIKASPGTPVKAANSGKVVYAGRMRGYGNLILLKHPDRFFTAYAHNRVNKVKAGDSVKQGDFIAEVGRTGRATGPHLHFEVREGEKARNPLFFLPVVH